MTPPDSTSACPTGVCCASASGYLIPQSLFLPRSRSTGGATSGDTRARRTPSATSLSGSPARPSSVCSAGASAAAATRPATGYGTSLPTGGASRSGGGIAASWAIWSMCCREGNDMRTLRDHIVEGDTNPQLTITVIDEPERAARATSTRSLLRSNKIRTCQEDIPHTLSAAFRFRTARSKKWASTASRTRPCWPS